MELQTKEQIRRLRNNKHLNHSHTQVTSCFDYYRFVVLLTVTSEISICSATKHPEIKEYDQNLYNAILLCSLVNNSTPLSFIASGAESHSRMRG
jgi:hypothetical protein